MFEVRIRGDLIHKNVFPLPRICSAEAPGRAPLGILVGAELHSTGAGGSGLHTEANVGSSGAYMSPQAARFCLSPVDWLDRRRIGHSNIVRCETSSQSSSLSSPNHL